MKELINQWKISPNFFRLLNAFGSKTFAKDEAFSGCHVAKSLDSHGQIDAIGKGMRECFEIC
jgi:hypothetical protein